MKLGIVLNSNEAETVWNVFRLANEALNKNHVVKIFLLGKGVEIESIQDNRFPYLEGAVKKFLKNNGRLLACGVCLQIRQKKEMQLCPISTMEELLALIEESDKVLTF